MAVRPCGFESHLGHFLENDGRESDDFLARMLKIKGLEGREKTRADERLVRSAPARVGARGVSPPPPTHFFIGVDPSTYI